MIGWLAEYDHIAYFGPHGRCWRSRPDTTGEPVRCREPAINDLGLCEECLLSLQSA